ncbi:hypothetical protein EDD85DRAFT_197083 [Armillaria nabsnona]|nr:hypothetical protein EDD85DRAFT_197083 [Armillaria nabsnona]
MTLSSLPSLDDSRVLLYSVLFLACGGAYIVQNLEYNITFCSCSPLFSDCQRAEHLWFRPRVLSLDNPSQAIYIVSDSERTSLIHEVVFYNISPPLLFLFPLPMTSRANSSPGAQRLRLFSVSCMYSSTNNVLTGSIEDLDSSLRSRSIPCLLILSDTAHNVWLSLMHSTAVASTNVSALRF